MIFRLYIVTSLLAAFLVGAVCGPWAGDLAVGYDTRLTISISSESLASNCNMLIAYCPDHYGQGPVRHSLICPQSSPGHLSGPRIPPPRYVRIMGLVKWMAWPDGNAMTLFVHFPAWLPITIFAGPPVALVTLRFGVRFLRRRRRRSRNCCLNCGYCLTGLPEPRCPECGKACEEVSLLKRAAVGA